MGFKKRYIVFGLLALEVVSLPFAASIVHKQAADFDISAITNPQRAINVELNAGPGVTRYLVTANAPFTVTSKNAIGTLNVNVYKSGFINGQAYGTNAQLPGAKSACTQTETTEKKTVYISERGTVAQKGDVLSETVLVEVRYDPSLTPDIKILTQKKSAKLLPAPLCTHINMPLAANET